VAEGLTGKGEFADKREITTKGLAEFVIKRRSARQGHEGRAGAAILGEDATAAG
jgi:nucleoid DNA-binding protein